MSSKKQLLHPCFPQPSDDSQKVWRYLSLPKFLDLVLTRSLFLSRADLLGDKYEYSVTKNLFSATNGRLRRGNNGVIETIAKYRQRMRRSMFVNCWRLDHGDSEAMWKVYCANNEGLAIQATYSKLADSVTNNPLIYIGLVSYIDYDKDEFDDGNVFSPIMYKRQAFEHEKEIRVVYSDPNVWNDISKDPNERFIKTCWDYQNVIENVYVNPYASDWYYNTIKGLFDELKLSMPLEWSNLKAEPYF